MNQRNWLAILAIVVGIMAGTWLAEFGRNSLYAEAVRFVNDILLSAPSVLIDATNSEHHIKHGIAAFVVGLALFVFAWFSLGKKKSAA